MTDRARVARASHFEGAANPARYARWRPVGFDYAIRRALTRCGRIAASSQSLPACIRIGDMCGFSDADGLYGFRIKPALYIAARGRNGTVEVTPNRSASLCRVRKWEELPNVGSEDLREFGVFLFEHRDELRDVFLRR